MRVRATSNQFPRGGTYLITDGEKKTIFPTLAAAVAAGLHPTTAAMYRDGVYVPRDPDEDSPAVPGASPIFLRVGTYEIVPEIRLTSTVHYGTEEVPIGVGSTFEGMTPSEIRAKGWSDPGDAVYVANEELQRVLGDDFPVNAASGAILFQPNSFEWIVAPSDFVYDPYDTGETAVPSDPEPPTKDDGPSEPDQDPFAPGSEE